MIREHHDIMETPDGMWVNVRTGTQYKNKRLAIQEALSVSQPNDATMAFCNPKEERVYDGEDAEEWQRRSEASCDLSEIRGDIQ